MSIEITRKGNQDYAYFYPGRGKKLYIGKVTIEGKSEIKIENLKKAIEYLDNKIEHYEELKQKLSSYMPEEEHLKFLPKEERLRGPTLQEQKEIGTSLQESFTTAAAASPSSRSTNVKKKSKKRKQDVKIK